MPSPFVLAIDQGTTSTRAVLYDADGNSRGTSSREITQHYPRPAWVEHDPEEIWRSVAEVVPRALEIAGVDPTAIAAIGVTNQRETVLIWERASSKPLTPAVVWQDRRTSDFCRQHAGEEPSIYRRTGLVLDPYFSATKLRWLLDQDPALRARAEAGQLACGTIDSWLIWQLTAGRVHATDVTNASRTLLVDLQTGNWDGDLCRFFAVPSLLLPEIRPSAADYGRTQGLDFLPDGLPILGVAGDQQAALVGQQAFAAGDAKCTYGTGAFFLMHTGTRPVASRHRLLTTITATFDKQLQYALEGSVFIAGAAVQWLRDGLRLFQEAPAIEELAARSDLEQPVLLVPGFAGLGAPHWVPEAKGVLFGLTRGTTAADVSRATLEGVAFQVADLIDAAANDAGQRLEMLRVDGGMARNAWFLQCQADLLGLPVMQSPHSESTALGAAFLAGLKAGVWPNLDALGHLPRHGRRYEPRMPQEIRQRRVAEWQRAVRAVIEFYRRDR
jgi:glycerol kinase